MTQNYYSKVFNGVIKYNLQLGNKGTQNTTAVWYNITAVRRHDQFKLESEVPGV